MTKTQKLTDDQIRDMLDNATDGPWVLNPDNQTSCDIYSQERYFHICNPTDGFCDERKRKANARLIAAAPDLARLALERGAEIDKLRELVHLLDENSKETSWGAAVGARYECIKGLRASLKTQEKPNEY